MPDQPQLALHKGVGLVSTLIRWQTRAYKDRNGYSHCSIILRAGDVIEAREFKGVRRLDGLQPEKKEVIDIFEIDYTLPNVEQAEKWLRELAEKKAKYDYWSIARFISRRQESKNSAEKFFCSELGYIFIQKCGLDLFRATEPWEVAPVWMARSPYMKHVDTIIWDSSTKQKKSLLASAEFLPGNIMGAPA